MLHWGVGVACALIVTHWSFVLYRKRQSRGRTVPPHEERIVILGASSVNGIGAAIARKCLEQGVQHIMLVGRRSEALREVKLAMVSAQETDEGKERAQKIELFVADCTDEEDVLRLSLAIAQDFGGVDTLYVVFGAICKQPLLSLASLDPLSGAKASQPTLEGLQAVSDTLQRSNASNITATALVLTALIPQLQLNGKTPYVAVIGSLASLVPAPTRALYSSTKAAQQMLVQSVALECASQAHAPGRALVRFVVLAPSTVATSFSTRLALGTQYGPRPPPARSMAHALSPAHVADVAVQCVDRGVTGVVPVPHKYFYAWLLAILFPRLVESGAHNRYGY